MPDKKLNLKIITPEKTVFDASVDSVILRTTDGNKGILPGHREESVLLDYGILKIFTADEEKQFAIMGGSVMVRENSLTVLSEIAEHPDDIDASRAKRAQERAESRLRSSDSELNTERAEMALRRALIRGELTVDLDR